MSPLCLLHARTSKQHSQSGVIPWIVMRYTHYTGHLISVPLAVLPYRTAFFKRAWHIVKVVSCPWSLWIPIKLDEVQYVSELPMDPRVPAIKVEQLKKTSDLLLKQTFFFSNLQLWRLLFLDPVGVRGHTVPQIKGRIKLDWNPKRPRAWQHYFSLLRPLEKKRFVGWNRQGCEDQMAGVYIAMKKNQICMIVPCKIETQLMSVFTPQYCDVSS